MRGAQHFFMMAPCIRYRYTGITTIGMDQVVKTFPVGSAKYFAQLLSAT